MRPRRDPAPGSIEYARKVLADKRTAEQQQQPHHISTARAASDQPQPPHQMDLYSSHSSIWDTLAFTGTLLQQVICQASQHSFAEQTVEDRSNTQAARAYLFKSLASMTNQAVVQVMSQDASSRSEPSLNLKVSSRIAQVASATINASGLLWGGLLKAIGAKIDSGQFSAISVIKAARYDETPLRVRYSDDNRGSETATHGKVMQSEMSLCILLKHGPSGRFWLVKGYVPCTLKLLDSTTAETTKAAILADRAQVPGLSSFCDRFKFKLQLATVDRFAANKKCERSLLHDADASWCKLTQFCNMHIVAQVHLKTTEHVSMDITGLVNTALAQHGAGTMHTLRDILRQIFRDDLTVRYDTPPQGRAKLYREQIFDLYLPLPDHVQDLSQVSCRTLIRRCVLGSMLNGSLEQDAITHYCPFGCCDSFENSLDKFSNWVTWCLLPHKAVRFARNRWTGQSESVAWAGLLASCHNLLARVMTKYTGVPGSVPAAVPISSKPGEGWDFLLDKTSVPLAIGNSVAAAEGGKCTFGFEQQEQEQEPHEASEQRAPGGDSTSWADLNKAFRTKCGRWSLSRPAGRLAVLSQVMSLTAGVVNKTLHVSSAKWEKEQQLLLARGESRSYRMLESATCQDLKKFFEGILKQFATPSAGIPHWACNSSLLKVHFAMLSRAGCSMHMLVRRPRSQQPYLLFKMLLPDSAAVDYRASSECLDDEFAVAFHARFPEWNDDAKAALIAAALTVEVDICAIEARHAATRRVVLQKNMQSWVGHVAAVSAEVACKQVQLLEQDVLPSSEQFASGLQRQQKQQRRAKPAKRRGGGGAYRAFLHTCHAGRAFTAQSIQDATNAFHALPDHERAIYETMGSQGTVAWRHGFKSFGEKVEAPSSSINLGMRASLADGAIVASDVATSMPLLPLAVRDLDMDVKNTRRAFLEHKKKAKLKEEEQGELLQKFRASLTKEAPAPFDNVRPESVFPVVYDAGVSDQVGAQVCTMHWFPSSTHIAFASWLPLV